MEKYSLPHFGNLDSANLEEYYHVDIDFDRRKIQIDLNFDNTSINLKRLDIAKQFINNISEFDKKNKSYIEQDYTDEACDTVRTYIQHHLEDMDKNELSGLVNFDNISTPIEIQLMNSLRLERVGLYPDRESSFAVFDYSLGQELTQYLVVINIDENGSLDYLTMES